jgi:beta-xylosidase
MEGPMCSGSVKLDLSKMRDGDVAGFAAFNDETCGLFIKKNGKKLTLQLNELSVKLSQREKAVESVTEKTVEELKYSANEVWLRIDADFRPGVGDKAKFYYSTDGTEWAQLGDEYKMRFDWQRFFMGSKFAIINYATKRLGGWIDVDAFSYQAGEK